MGLLRMQVRNQLEAGSMVVEPSQVESQWEATSVAVGPSQVQNQRQVAWLWNPCFKRGLKHINRAHKAPTNIHILCIAVIQTNSRAGAMFQRSALLLFICRDLGTS